MTEQDTASETVDRPTWLERRRALLAEEKALQRQRDEVARRRRALGRVPVETDYVFEDENGPVTLAGLFGGLGQLVVYHFMFHPDWDEGCKSCSFWIDGFDGGLAHLAARDTAFACVARAPIDKLTAYRDRMGWRCRFASSLHNDFNKDFQVSFDTATIESGRAQYNYRETDEIGEEMPGISVFCRDRDDTVFHTYSTYSRGLDPFNPVYQLLDIVPKGRDEDAGPMHWLRRHDAYR